MGREAIWALHPADDGETSHIGEEMALSRQLLAIQDIAGELLGIADGEGDGVDENSCVNARAALIHSGEGCEAGRMRVVQEGADADENLGWERREGSGDHPDALSGNERGTGRDGRRSSLFGGIVVGVFFSEAGIA
jgi:hypothetical protein